MQDNVKIVTFRSTYKIENQTLYPLELTLVDELGQPMDSLEKLGKEFSFLEPPIEPDTMHAAPGQDYSLPIEAVTRNRVRIRPDRKASVLLCLLCAH